MTPIATTSSAAPVVGDSDIPEGELRGLDEHGTLVVSLQYMPEYKMLIGDEAAYLTVKKWLISPDGARRMARIAAWNAVGWPTLGNA